MEEQYIPIDIHTNKLSDWLISRRHCNRDWPSRILTIREKINNAIQDMPVHEGIAKLLSGSYINYFHCLKIIEILKETEADSKNFFGSYGSKRMKDWQEIVRLYEKDNVYLAEAAQMLIRNVAYEVPLLKKQIAKLEQLQQDCDKKDTEYGKAAVAAKAEFQTLCKQLGIQGQSIKRELVELLKELPEIYNKIARNTNSLQQPVEFYTEFVKFIFGKEHPGGCVPLLKYMIDKGNTTVYEWRYGEPPLKIEEPPLSFTFEDEETNADTDTIDFGEDAEANIDFGDLNQQESITLETGDIDWGISTNEESAENNNLEELDLNISLEDCGITVESSGVEGGVAKNVEALTILDNPATRNQFIDELLEVEAFLKVRLNEMQGPSNILSLSQLQDAKPLLQLQTTESVTAMLEQVQVVIKEVTASRSQHLYNIKHSPRYVDHLASKLNQKLGVVDKMIASQQAVRMRKKDVLKEIHDLQPKLKLIIAKTKELQAEIEADISKRYKNRPVNLMGGVNVL